jgi:hypothetical protein
MLKQRPLITLLLENFGDNQPQQPQQTTTASIGWLVGWLVGWWVGWLVSWWSSLLLFLLMLCFSLRGDFCLFSVAGAVPHGLLHLCALLAADL